MDGRTVVKRAFEQEPVMPLGMAHPGETVEMVCVRGGPGVERRLADLSLGPGSRFTVETRGRPGPFVVRVKDSRLILGQGMVQHVFVRPVR